MANARDNDEVGAELVVYILLIPIFLIGLAGLLLAWFASLAGARYNYVKFLTLPASLIISNFVGMLLLIPILFVAALISGNGDLFHFGHIADVTLFTAVRPIIAAFWNSPQIPWVLAAYGTGVFTIIAYQAIIWWLLGRRFSRHFGMALFDASVVRIARSKNEVPSELRQEIAESDALYAKDALYYQNQNRAPWLGMFFVWIAGEAPSAYY